MPPGDERELGETAPIAVTGAAPGSGLIARLAQAQKREREHVLAEVLKVRGLLPLLMKQRNGQRWSAAERRELLDDLRALSELSPYLVALAMPGSVLMLPLLAWWLDRRRRTRR